MNAVEEFFLQKVRYGRGRMVGKATAMLMRGGWWWSYQYQDWVKENDHGFPVY